MCFRCIWCNCFVAYYSKVKPFKNHNNKIINLILFSRFRKKFQFKADPMICALGSLLSVPALLISVLITRSANLIYFWIMTFTAIASLSMNWTLMADIQIYVIHPNKRSSANALNILLCHLFGDAISPFIIGAVSLYYSHFITIFKIVIGLRPMN